VVDLGLTCLCVLTLLVILFAGCGATSKEEELLDTLLLVARNVLQFGRLATVMRRFVLPNSAPEGLQSLYNVMPHSLCSLDPVVQYFPVQEQSTYRLLEPRV